MEKTKSEIGNGQKIVEIVRMSKELNKEKERHHTLEELLNIKYEELRQELEKIKKENERIETTLENLGLVTNNSLDK